MVLESTVTGLLNKYLGEFIENLDAEQVRVGMLSGRGVLRGLRLRRDAVARLLGLPFEVCMHPTAAVTTGTSLMVWSRQSPLLFNVLNPEVCRVRRVVST